MLNLSYLFDILWLLLRIGVWLLAYVCQPFLISYFLSYLSSIAIILTIVAIAYQLIQGGLISWLDIRVLAYFTLVLHSVIVIILYRMFPGVIHADPQLINNPLQVIGWGGADVYSYVLIYVVQDYLASNELPDIAATTYGAAPSDW